MKILAIGAKEIEKTECLIETISALRKAFSELQASAVLMPPRTIVVTSKTNPSRQLAVMPAVLESQKVAVVKVTTLTPANRENHLPLIHGLVTLVDLDTGQIVAMLEGAALTSLRTGAVSALATQLLSREDSRKLAVIGAGVQARMQLRAVAAVREIDTIFLFSRTSTHVNSFADWINGHPDLKLKIHICNSLREAVKETDIVCTATSTNSSTPLIERSWIGQGTHINAVGGVNEEACEFDPALLQNAYTVVEESEAALADAGEIRSAVRSRFISEADIIEIAKVINGQAPARKSTDQITVFRSVGVAIEDAAAAKTVYDRATRSGGGFKISL